MSKTRIILPKSSEFNTYELNIRNWSEVVSKGQSSTESFQKVFASKNSKEMTAIITKYSKDKVILSVERESIGHYMYIEDVERVLAGY